MRTFGLLFAASLLVAPLLSGQAKPDVPAHKVASTPTPTVKPEPLPELLAVKITLIQSEYEKAGLILKATPAYQAWEAKTSDLGRQMDALLTPYQAANKCVVDQIAKTCTPAKDAK